MSGRAPYASNLQADDRTKQRQTVTVILDWLAEHTGVRVHDRGLRLVLLEITFVTTTIHTVMNVAMIPDVPMALGSPGIDHFLQLGSEVAPVDRTSLQRQAVPTNDLLKVVEGAMITWRPLS